MPAAEHEAVFGEFYRATTITSGFGLGLALCRRVMTLHGGSIRVARSDDNGTVFAMELPSGAGGTTA